MNPKLLFSTIPSGPQGNGDEQVDRWYDEKDRRQHRWFNRYYEHSGTRVRFIAGDVHAMMECESGGRGDLDFGIALNLFVEDVPEFYLPDNEHAKYDIHTLNVTFWRWGIYLSIRGRVQ